MPTRNTGYIIDHDDNEFQNVTIPHPTTPPPATGFLPFLLSLLLTACSVLVEEMLDVAVFSVLNNGLVPTLMVMKCVMVSIFTSATQPFHSRKARERVHSGEDPLLPHGTTAGEDGIATEDKAAQIASLAKVAAIQTAVISSLDRQLTKTTKSLESLNIETEVRTSRLYQKERNLVATLRAIVDPSGIHPSESISSLVEDLEDRRKKAAKELKRASTEIKRLTDEGQLGQKDAQISTLTTTNSTFSRRVADLEKQVSSAAEEAKWAKTASEDVQKRLKQRALDAEKLATEGMMPIQAYRSKLDEIHRLEGLVANADQEIANAQREKTNAQQETANARREKTNAQQEIINAQQAIANAQREKTNAQQEIINAQQAIANAQREKTNAQQETINAQQQAATAQKETQAVRREGETTLQNLRDEVSNGKAQAKELQASIELANQKAQDAEEKARAAEENFAETVEKANELRKSLQEAQKKAKGFQESNKELTQRLEAAEGGVKEKKPEPEPVAAGEASSEGSVAEVNDLRFQLGKANEATLEAFQSGYLNALSQSGPSGQSEETAAEPSDFENQAMRMEGYWVGVADTKQETKVAIDKALQDERFEAELRLGMAEVQKEQEVRDEVARLWTTESEKLQGNVRKAEAEAERLRELGKGVEEQLRGVKKQLDDTTQELGNIKELNRQQTDGMRLLKGRNDSLEAGQSLYNKNIKGLGDLYRQTKTELENNKKELAARKSALLSAKEADLAKEIEAVDRDLERARDLMEEIVDTPLNRPAQDVFDELFALNSAINLVKLELKKPGQEVDMEGLLDLLVGSQVEEDLLNDLPVAERPVLVNQSRMANKLLFTLIHKLDKEKNVQKDALLAKMIQPRGDETELKRKLDDDDDDDDSDHDQSNKRSDNKLSFGRSYQQGSSSLRTDDDTDLQNADTLPVSQHDSASSDRIGEATAPQQQSKDQTNLSPHPPGSPSFPIQYLFPAFPTISPSPSPQAEYTLHPKPSKIPGPKPKAYPTPSERHGGLAIGQHKDNKATLAQSAAAPFSSEGPTVFSFTAPKDIASGILPHVRKYTRLSGTSNTVLSRRQTHASTAIPGANLQRTITIGRSYGAQECSTPGTSSVRR